MSSITLFTTAEYEATEFDAVLVRENAVVCVRADEENLRVVPLDKVNHVDGDADMLLVETEIPDSFYGGAKYGFVDTAQFPEIESHLDALSSEDY